MTSIMNYFNGAAINTLSYRRLGKNQLSDILYDVAHQTSTSEITITFKECWRKAMTNTEILNMMYAYFRTLGPQYGIPLVAMVPEYGNNNNLHFHGLIQGKPKDLSELLSFMKRRFGRTEIRMIHHPQKYYEYLLKEQEEMTDAFVIREDETITLTEDPADIYVPPDGVHLRCETPPLFDKEDRLACDYAHMQDDPVKWQQMGFLQK